MRNILILIVFITSEVLFSQQLELKEINNCRALKDALYNYTDYNVYDSIKGRLIFNPSKRKGINGVYIKKKRINYVSDSSKINIKNKIVALRCKKIKID